MAFQQTCGGLTFSLLQNSYSTTIGIALAYPILSQIIEVKNLKTMQEARKLLKKDNIVSDRIAFLDISRKITSFQFYLDKIGNVNSIFIVSNAIFGILCFFVLNLSVFHSDYCLSNSLACSSIFLTSVPFLCGLFYLLIWYDASAVMYGMIKFYDSEY